MYCHDREMMLIYEGGCVYYWCPVCGRREYLQVFGVECRTEADNDTKAE